MSFVCDKLVRKVEKLFPTTNRRRCSLRSFRLSILYVAFVCISLCVAYNLWSSSHAVPLEYDAYSEEVMHLYSRFLTQYKLSRSNPLATANDRVPIPENPNYKRTKTVQYLYDYIEAATNELFNIERVRAQPKRIECVDSFSDETTAYLPAFTKAVRSLLSDIDGNQNNYTLYHSRMKAFTQREIITQDSHFGLPATVGQLGVFVTQFLPQFTVIDHYFGDEYLDREFDANFYSFLGMQHHPFGQKWRYWISIPFDEIVDVRYNLQHLEVPIASDIFFAYNHSKYYMSDERNDGNLDILRQHKDVWAPFINDARKNLYSDFSFDGDAKRKNCEFVQCLIDGVSQTFVIAIRDIQENEQLFIYYGPDPF